ncbi:helix-turn-helix domain-containing protein [Nocardiopsis dassonvillei]|uniref:IclR family transcriptional regulator n=1 Tax=Nocardiopsis dassonvillei TaxID=2014 RepID=UPI00200DB4B0|nr:helix-turn-helix domain-containing protein [Nocardiopsis dassonvillei]MCK9869079.1 helix-turn-helix domain-containing protein [Nocardiopsis dassonvillei]
MYRTTGVGVLDRVVAILDAVEHTPMGASDVAHHLGLSVPTAHRLVASMVAHGLLRRDAQGRHHHGRRFAVSRLSAMADPFLADLSRTTGESAQLWVLRGEHRVCLASADSASELRASLPVGTALALSEKGSAAQVLAGASTEDAEPSWVESVSRRTPGLCSVSTAVRLRGEVIAALCLAAPVSRVGEQGPGRLYGDVLLATAERIERALDVQDRP